MQNPNEDTEWNDILRSKGILPPKEKEISEDEIVQLVESTVQNKVNETKDLDDYTLDELDLIEDEEDERVLLEFRKKRIQELMLLQEKQRYGTVEEITAHEYVSQVNKAGEGIWVVLHLYKQGIPLCSLLNEHLKVLAAKYRCTKFLKSISTTCVPNFPDKNLPTIFIYQDGEMKAQLIGPAEFRHSDISEDELEWLLGKTGAIETDIKEDPRPKVKDVMFSSLKTSSDDCSGKGVQQQMPTTYKKCSQLPQFVSHDLSSSGKQRLADVYRMRQMLARHNQPPDITRCIKNLARHQNSAQRKTSKTKTKNEGDQTMRPNCSKWSVTVAPKYLLDTSSVFYPRKPKRRVKIVYKGTQLKNKLDKTIPDLGLSQEITYCIKSVEDDRIEIMSKLDLKTAKTLLDTIKKSGMDVWNNIYKNVEKTTDSLLSPNIIVEVESCIRT